MGKSRPAIAEYPNPAIPEPLDVLVCFEERGI